MADQSDPSVDPPAPKDKNTKETAQVLDFEGKQYELVGKGRVVKQQMPDGSIQEFQSFNFKEV